MNNKERLEWLLSGDLSIQYQVKRDLLDIPEIELTDLQQRIPTEGYVNRYLSYRDKKTGLWGGGLYSPKWISTHYTLLELKNLCIPQDHPEYRESADLLLEGMWITEGRRRSERIQDLCVVGMMCSIACYGHSTNPKIFEMIDYTLAHIQEDGGFNCSWPRSKKSSIHTTLTMLIFIEDYKKNGYTYRLGELEDAVMPAQEWLLERELYHRKTDGTLILKNIKNTPYPNRYRYDILKALEYFAMSKVPYDPRMQKAFDIILDKQLKSGAWPSSSSYSGLTFFSMERDKLGSKINTLRVLRVLKAYGIAEKRHEENR